MRTNFIEILDKVSDDILFAAGANDATNGIDPEDPESSISAYYRGRASGEMMNLGAGFAKALCGAPQ